MASYATDRTKIRPIGELYIALDGLDFSWYPREVEEVIQMWNEGVAGEEIINKIGRDGDEVALLIMDLVRSGVIKNRPGGICGYA